MRNNLRAHLQKEYFEYQGEEKPPIGTTSWLRTAVNGRPALVLSFPSDFMLGLLAASERKACVFRRLLLPACSWMLKGNQINGAKPCCAE